MLQLPRLLVVVLLSVVIDVLGGSGHGGHDARHHSKREAALRRDSAVGDQPKKHRHRTTPASVIEQSPSNSTNGTKAVSWPKQMDLARGRTASKSGFKVKMPKSFDNLLSDMWRGYVWQVYANRYGSSSREKTQFTNVMCPAVHAKEMTLQSAGPFGEITQVNLNINSACKGAYCWQKRGWVSRGKFKSDQAGKLDLLFPPYLPEIGEKSFFESPGENGAWCAPEVEAFHSELIYEPTGAFSKLERRKVQDMKFWRDAVCSAIRRKVEYTDTQNEIYEIPMMTCSLPYGPVIVSLILIMLELCCCWQVYQFRMRQFKRWVQMDNMFFEYYKMNGSVPSAKTFEDIAGPPPEVPGVLLPAQLLNPDCIDDPLISDSIVRDKSELVDDVARPVLKAPASKQAAAGPIGGNSRMEVVKKSGYAKYSESLAHMLGGTHVIIVDAVKAFLNNDIPSEIGAKNTSIFKPFIVKNAKDEVQSITISIEVECKGIDYHVSYERTEDKAQEGAELTVAPAVAAEPAVAEPAAAAAGAAGAAVVAAPEAEAAAAPAGDAAPPQPSA